MGAPSCAFGLCTVKEGVCSAVRAVFAAYVDESVADCGCAGFVLHGRGEVVILAEPVIHRWLVRAVGSRDFRFPFLCPGVEACGELRREI